jgi:tryptophan synthase beta chain
MSQTTKIFLSEKDMPRQWYNIAADLPSGVKPPLGPDGNPISPDALAPVFPMNLIEQEVSTDRWIDIPEEILAYWLNGGLLLFIARMRLRKRLERPQKFILKMKVFHPQGAINQIPPYLRPGITNSSVLKN